MTAHRILHIIDALGRDGATRQIGLLAQGLPRDEFEQHVCFLGRAGAWADDSADDLPRTELPRRLRWDPYTAWQLRRLVLRWQPGLVQAWGSTAQAYTCLAAAASVRGMMTVERWLDDERPPRGWRLDRRLAKRTSCLVANSPAVRDFCIAHGLPAGKFEVIPDAAARPQTRTSRQELLDQLGLSGGARLIGAVGPLWAENRFKDLIWAADILKIVHDDVHLVILGEGPHRSRLERYRAAIRVDDRVHLPGMCQNVDDWLPHFDAFWSAGTYDGLPHSVLSAMAAAVPVVAADSPGARQAVVDRQTGYLVPVGDRAEFARATHRLLNDPALARRLGQAGQERAESQFSPADMAARYRQLYRRLSA
jgi:glycosyltransferase involved in cell wall biosynthesis